MAGFLTRFLLAVALAFGAAASRAATVGPVQHWELPVPGSIVVTTTNGLTGLALGSCLSSTGGVLNVTCGTGGGSGSVTSFSFVAANGFTGSVATGTSTPALTLSVSVSGLLKGAAGSLAAATAGTDFLAPTGSGAGLTGLTYAQMPALIANQVLGSLSAGAPGGQSVPSCSGASNALIWTSGSGFGCNTIAGGGGNATNVRVVTAAGGVTVLSTDGTVVIKKTVAATTAVTLEASPTTGAIHVVKDGAGNAASFPITISPATITVPTSL